jgi:hypothetical protein
VRAEHQVRVVRPQISRRRVVGEGSGLRLHVPHVVIPRGTQRHIDVLPRVSEDSVQLAHDGAGRGTIELRMHRHDHKVVDAVRLHLAHDLGDRWLAIALCHVDGPAFGQRGGEGRGLIRYDDRQRSPANIPDLAVQVGRARCQARGARPAEDLVKPPQPQRPLDDRRVGEGLRQELAHRPNVWPIGCSQTDQHDAPAPPSRRRAVAAR